MEREDLPTLRALGFEDDELKELELWTPAVGAPAELAEMYVRRSKKKDSLSSLREQIRRMATRAMADKLHIRHVWFEQKSASKAYVRREEFEKATEAVYAHGLSKTLYVFKTSRLSRRGMGQIGLLLDKFEEKGARVFAESEGLDSRTSRMVFAVMGETARDQVKDLGEFTQNGIIGSKRDGKWTGGVTPYGLRAVKGEGRLERNPDEYPTARRVAEYLLERKTPHWIASTLNEEGLKTRHGRNWQATGIIALAHAVTWAGLVAQRERILDADGQWFGTYHRGGTPLFAKNGNPVSCGEGVITFAEHVKIKTILASRSQKGTSIGDRTRGKREIVALLSSSLRCGLCSGPMANGGVNYRCYARQTEGESSCKGVSTERTRVDSAVETLWINHILALSPESDTLHAIARDWLSYKDPEKEARKAQVTATLEAAVGREIGLRKERFVLGRMSEADYEYLWRELNAQIDSLKVELATLSIEADLSPLMDPETLTGLWNGAGISGQRALLRAALTEKGITLLPSRYRGDRTPILDRLVPHWRDGKDLAALAAINAGVERVERDRQQSL
ncbi:recombinase family protein [Streptomyces sp. NPDC055210]